MPGWLRRLFGGAQTGPAWIDAGELRRRIESGEEQLIVDVRGADEFDGPLGHIEGALNIPLPNLRAQTPGLMRAAMPIVLVCLTDKRSSQAAADLAADGIRNVAVLRGGMRAWRGG